MLKVLTTAEKLHFLADEIERLTERHFDMRSSASCFLGFASRFGDFSALVENDEPGNQRYESFRNLINPTGWDDNFNEKRTDRKRAAATLRRYADGETIEADWMIK